MKIIVRERLRLSFRPVCVPLEFLRLIPSRTFPLRVFAFPHSMGKSKKRNADMVAMSFAGWLAKEESDDFGCARYYLIPIGEGTLAGDVGAMGRVFDAFRTKKIRIQLYHNRDGNGRLRGRIFYHGTGKGELPEHAKPAAINRAKFREAEPILDDWNAEVRLNMEKACCEILKEFDAVP